jgi:hypothetical protein
MSSLQIEPAAKLLLHIFLSDFPLCAVIACSLLVGFYSRILSLMYVGSLNSSGFSDMKESSSWKCIIPALQNDKTSCCCNAAALQQLVYKISLTCKDWALFNCTARKFSVHFQQLNNLGWLSYPPSTPAPYGWSSGSMLAKFWSSPSSTCKSVQIESTISRSTSTCKSPLSECQPAASTHSNL